jgi:hypothetical protein
MGFPELDQAKFHSELDRVLATTIPKRFGERLAGLMDTPRTW